MHPGWVDPPELSRFATHVLLGVLDEDASYQLGAVERLSSALIWSNDLDDLGEPPFINIGATTKIII